MHRLFVTPSPARRSFAELVFVFGFVLALLLGSAAAEATVASMSTRATTDRIMMKNSIRATS
jgi:hypothetical protein